MNTQNDKNNQTFRLNKTDINILRIIFDKGSTNIYEVNRIFERSLQTVKITIKRLIKSEMIIYEDGDSFKVTKQGKEYLESLSKKE